jgi:hypothetical protein
MTRLHLPEPSKHRARRACLRRNHVCQRRRALVATVAVTTIAFVMEAILATERLLNPEPYHTSRLSGRRWVEELKDGHPDRMADNIGVRPAVFSKLEQELVLKGGLLPSRWVDTSEMLAIYLYQVVTNSTIRKTAERFQRSNETISK